MSQTASRSRQPRQDVTAALTFIVPQDTKPFFESAALTGGEPRIHFRVEQRSVTVRDMPVVQACGVVFAGVYIVLNMLADIGAILANPRLMHPK